MCSLLIHFRRSLGGSLHEKNRAKEGPRGTRGGTFETSEARQSPTAPVLLNSLITINLKKGQEESTMSIEIIDLIKHLTGCLTIIIVIWSVLYTMWKSTRDDK
jgi:hypothetical protein